MREINNKHAVTSSEYKLLTTLNIESLVALTIALVNQRNTVLCFENAS